MNRRKYLTVALELSFLVHPVEHTCIIKYNIYQPLYIQGHTTFTNKKKTTENVSLLCIKYRTFFIKTKVNFKFLVITSGADHDFTLKHFGPGMDDPSVEWVPIPPVEGGGDPP